MKWTTLATFTPSPNCTPGGMGPIKGVVLHIAEGYYHGTISWAQNTSSEVSYHFLAGKNDGERTQLVDTADRAWAQKAGNPNWLSLCFSGFTGDAGTDNQIAMAAQVLAMAHLQYGVPLAVTDDPATGGLGWHSMGRSWGRYQGDCPGEPVLAQRLEIIARAAQIVGGEMDVTTPVQISENSVNYFAGYPYQDQMAADFPPGIFAPFGTHVGWTNIRAAAAWRQGVANAETLARIEQKMDEFMAAKG